MDGRRDQLVDEDLMEKNAAVAPPAPDSEGDDRQEARAESAGSREDGRDDEPPERRSPG